MEKNEIIEAISLYNDACEEKYITIDVGDITTMLEECNSIKEIKKWLLENI